MPLDVHYNLPYRPAFAVQRPSSPPLRAQPLQEPPQRASPPPLKVASTISPIHETDAPQVALFVQPASPALPSSASFATASELASPPEPSTSFLPPSPQGFGGSLAARRQLNKKRLSLVVPNAGPSASSLSPTTPSFLLPGGTSSDADAETRSLPPSPVSLQGFIGAEGSEENDRTIGRLMMKQQADEMREQMKGGRGMKRRTSIPRLNLAAPPPGKLGGGGGKPAPLKLGSTNGGSAVQLLRRDGIERNVDGNSPDGAAEGDEVAEEFPYALGPREILPGIFLGSEQNARDPAVLREWGIGFVLNVAKEVDCPWVDDVIVEEEEPVSATLAAEPFTTSDTFTTSLGSAPSSDQPDRARPKHRRTKTQAVVAVPEVAEAPPHFVRPTSSTPNLQSIFNSSALPSPPPPAVPPLPNDLDALDRIAMSRSLSCSPPQARRSPPQTRKALHYENGAPATPTSTVGGVIRFPANPRTGRPPLEYLWLKWGHDESDLVEAQKFQSAFDFLDHARASEGGNGRVLVHCQCGVSRSATAVIAYIMREAAKALEDGREVAELASCTGMHDTYSFVKEKSEWVGPNLGLVFQLVAYERTLRGGADASNEEESLYPDYPPEPEDGQQFDYSHPGYSAHSPRTPISSEGSSASDSHLSTPEVDPPMVMPPPAFTTSAKSPASPLSVLVGPPPSLSSRVVILDDDEEALTPIAEVLHIHEQDAEPADKAPLTANGGVFILPMPPSRASRFACLPHDDTPAPPFEEVVPSPTTAFRPSFPSQLGDNAASSPVGTRPSRAASVGANSNPFARLGLHAMSSRPTPASAHSPMTADAPSPAQLALLREEHGRPPLQRSSSSSSSAAAAAAESSQLGLSRSGSGVSPSRATFGGQQTPSERRASHRRVFSDTMSLPAFLRGRSVSAAPAMASAAEATKTDGRE